MEANSKPNVLGMQSLPQLLRASYKAKDNQELQQSERLLKELLTGRDSQHLAFLSLYDILTKPYEDQLKDATCVQLKSLCYSMASPLPPENTPFYLQQLYTLLTQNGFSRIQRQYIGTAIQHFLNNDQKCLYKNALFTKALMDLASNDINVLHGALEAYMSYFNSLTQIEEQAINFIQSAHLLKGMLIRLNDMWVQSKNDTEESTLPLVHLMDRIMTIVDILVTRILDERQIAQQEVLEWEQDQDWPKIFHIYLLIGTNENVRTLVCYHKHATIFNNMKESLLKFMFVAYPKLHQFILIECYQTFMNGMIAKTTNKLAESQNNLMAEAFNILECQIKLPEKYNFLSHYAVSMIIKSLEYLRPTSIQLQKLNDEPQEFIKQLCDSCQFFQLQSPFVKACNLVFTIQQTVDGIKDFIASLINILIQYSFEEPTEQVTPLLQQFKQFEIFNAPPKDRIAIGLQLMCLQVLKDSTPVRMFMTMIKLAVDFDDPCVITRCMMAIAKMRVHAYSPWLIQQMPRCEAFRLIGLESFSRLLRHPIHPSQSIPIFIDSLSKALDFMDVNCPTFQRLLLDNYQNLVVLHQHKLGKTIHMLINRIGTLQNSKVHYQQQQLIALYNMLEAIIIKEERLNKLLEIQEIIVKIDNKSEHIQSIMSMILLKSGRLTEPQRRMAGKLLYRPFMESINNTSLLYLNRIVAYEENPENIFSLIEVLCQVVIELTDETIINQICVILGQVIVKCKKSNKIIEEMVRLKSLQFDLTKGRMMELLLLTLFVGDAVSPDIYTELHKVSWSKLCLLSNLPLDRKICVVGLCNIVEIQCKNGQFPLNVIFQIATVLKKHCDQKKIQHKKYKKRKIKELVQVAVEQNIDDTDHKIEFKDGGILDQKTHHLMQYQHPLLSVNDLGLFQETVKKYREHLQKICNGQQLQLLRDLLETMEDNKGRTRRILKIKQ